MGRTACTEPHCLYNNAFYLFHPSVNAYLSLGGKHFVIFTSFFYYFYSDTQFSLTVLQESIITFNNLRLVPSQIFKNSPK